MKKILIALSALVFSSCSIVRKGNQATVLSPQSAIALVDERSYKDQFWLAPQARYIERRAAFLKFCADNADIGGRDGVFTQVARMELGLPVNEKLVREAIDVVYENKDCNDFSVGGLVRIYYLNKERNQLSAQLLKEIEACLLSFKYWWDEPIRDENYRCYHTENHQGLYHSDELLAGQLFKEKQFKNQKNGQYHIDHASLLINRWLDFRCKFGFSEWLSNTYYDVELMLLSNLYDFAEDKTIREKAGVLIDLLMYDMALNNYKGVFGSTHGRAYSGNIKSGWNETTSSAMKLMFGVGVFNDPRSMGAVSLATSNYRCPEVIERIATDYAKPLWNFQRQSLNVEDAPSFGLAFNDELNTHLFWGMQEFIHPNVVEMSKVLSEKYDTWPYRNYDSYIRRYNQEVAEHGKVLNPNLDRFALSEANIQTYRTADFMLSSAQDYRPGSKGYQQHIWQATLGPEAVVFTNNPGSTEEKWTPNLWAGSEVLPRAAQYRNVLICIYNIPEKNKLAYSHAYFPRESFDEVKEVGNWIFARKADGYLALFSQNIWGRGRKDEVLVTSPQNIWLCEVGNKSEWKSFDRFVSAVSTAKVQCKMLDVQYKSPSVGELKFGWAAPFAVNGKIQKTDKYPRFDNSYTKAAFNDPMIRIEDGKKPILLNLKDGKRENLR